MAQGLRPGDRVQVLAAFTEGARRGRAVVLLPTAEVVRVLEDAAGLTGSGQERGVQLRMPSDRAPVVAAAIATARIFVVKAPGLAPDPAVAGDPPSGTREPATAPEPTTGSGPADGVPPDTGPPATGSPDTAPPATAPPDTGSSGTGAESLSGRAVSR